MNIIPFEKSFASCEKSKYWSEKNELKPHQVYNVTAKKNLFNCPNCNHEFLQNPSHIKRGSWCPYCANKKLCGIKECVSCFDKSFASNELSKYWSEKNELKPEFVLHLWTFKTPTFALKKSKNVKSILMVLLFLLLFYC